MASSMTLSTMNDTQLKERKSLVGSIWVRWDDYTKSFAREQALRPLHFFQEQRSDAIPIMHTTQVFYGLAVALPCACISSPSQP